MKIANFFFLFVCNYAKIAEICDNAERADTCMKLDCSHTAMTLMIAPNSKSLAESKKFVSKIRSQSHKLSNGTLVITCPLNNFDACGTNLTVTKDNIEISTFLQYEGATFINLGRNRLSYGTSAPGMQMNCIYSRKITLDPVPYTSNTPGGGEPGGKISADGSLKPSFTFTLDKDSAIEFGQDVSGRIAWNNRIPNMSFSIDECKIDNKIYIIKGGCPSSLLKVKTSWYPFASSLSFRFPVFRLSTHDEGAFEISCTIDIHEGRSRPVSQCSQAASDKPYRFILPEIRKE